MSDFKPGVNVLLTRARNPLVKHLVGTVHTLHEQSSVFKCAWLMTPPIRGTCGSECSWGETGMIPLRDSDGQDETLTWAPVPKKVEA